MLLLCPGNGFLWCVGTGAPVPPAGMAGHGGNPPERTLCCRQAYQCHRQVYQCHRQVPALRKWFSGAGRSNMCQGDAGAGRATRNAPSAPPAALPHTPTCSTGRHISCREQMALVISFSFCYCLKESNKIF